MGTYQDMLKNLEQKPDRKLNDHILLIDSMNLFIRGFCVLQSINPQGHHTGGLIGYLRSLGFLQREFDPTRIICIFDGNGSTINRKAINPEYKANRSGRRITNWSLFDDKEDEYASMTMQLGRLVEYLQCLPVGLLSIDMVEADDVIAFLALKFSQAGKKVTIISSDKDFLQIVDDNIQVYSPIIKKMYNPIAVKEHLQVTPSNYLILKALTGDNSDNLRGIKGLGTKTILKEFKEIGGEVTKDLQYIYDIAYKKMKDKKIFASIIYDWSRVEQNYLLMNLQQPRLSDEEVLTILEKVKISKYDLQGRTFTKMLEQDQIEGLNINIESWLDRFHPLSMYRK